MQHLNEFAPMLIGLILGWYVILGARELFKEASVAVMKKSNA